MRSLLLIAVLLTLSTNLTAQGRPNTRQGLWFGFGVGGGSAGADCNMCSDDRTSGFSGYARIGGTVSPSFLLGAETSGWFHSENGFDESIGFLNFVVLWYPGKTGAAHIKAGIGAMGYSLDDGVNELTATAPSGLLGFGYDIRTGRNFSLVPFFNVYGSSPVSARFNGAALPLGSKIKVNLVQLGLGFTWH